MKKKQKPPKEGTIAWELWQEQERRKPTPENKLREMTKDRDAMIEKVRTLNNKLMNIEISVDSVVEAMGANPSSIADVRMSIETKLDYIGKHIVGWKESNDAYVYEITILKAQIKKAYFLRDVEEEAHAAGLRFWREQVGVALRTNIGFPPERKP